MPFENWNVGQDLFQTLDKESDLLDRDVRPFAEECDQLQGLQVFTGTDDAWGGFSATYIDSLRDEYGKASIWVWGLEDGQKASRQKQLLRTMNSARSIQSLAQQASAYVTASTLPPSLPEYVHLEKGSDWSSSALMATAIETIMLPSRLRRNGGRQAPLSFLEAALNTNGRQNIFELAANVSASENVTEADAEKVTDINSHANTALIPRMVHEDESSEPISAFDINYTSRQTHALTGLQQHIFSQISVQRGSRRHARLTNDADSKARNEVRMPGEATIVENFDTTLKFPLLDTFPRTLFSASATTTRTQGLTVRAALTTTSNTKHRLKDMRQLVNRAMGPEEREMINNDLAELAVQYEHEWTDDTDSGEDE